MTFTTTEYAKPSRPRWVLPAVVGMVVVALVAVVTALVLNRSNDTPAAPAPSGPASTNLTTPPRQLEWKLIDGVRLPYSKTDGPARIVGPLATGYSHTPQGAVVAAWQISTRMLTVPDYEQVLGTQCLGSEADRTQVRNGVTAVRSLSSDQFAAHFAQPIAYKFVAYGPYFAHLYFATPSPQGGYDFAGRAVVWSDRLQDWQYQLVSGLPQLPNSTSLDGFTTF